MERRNNRRLPCRAPVRIYADEGAVADSFFLDSADVCGDGVFLRTDLLFPVGEWLELEFSVPGRPAPVRGRGRVIRVEMTRRAAGPGVAVQLVHFGQEERRALARLRCDLVRDPHAPSRP